jgi:hypothetical protein
MYKENNYENSPTSKMLSGSGLSGLIGHSLKRWSYAILLPRYHRHSPSCTPLSLNWMRKSPLFGLNVQSIFYLDFTKVKTRLCDKMNELHVRYLMSAMMAFAWQVTSQVLPTFRINKKKTNICNKIRDI